MSEQTKTDKASPYFSIVIPAYNEADHIKSCLQSIFNSHYDSTQYEVIVVDNGSQDRSYEIALSYECVKAFKLLDGNVGAVRNYGAAQARGQILIFIDADCLMDNDWLNRAEKLIGDHPNYAYGGGAKPPSNATWIETSWLLEGKGQPTLPTHLIGASTMLSKELFLKIGGFDEVVSSGEDTDLHYRIISEDIPVLLDHALDVTHLGNAKTSFQFMRRQIWHSENYLTNLIGSLKDPVFLVTLTFLFSSFLIIIQSFFSTTHIIALSNLALWAFLPALLSCKRILRAGYFTLRPKILIQIYFLDFLYLTGRSIGLLKGVFRKSR
jgi:glycosyltransferase involved in cell wall biosynthesis